MLFLQEVIAEVAAREGGTFWAESVFQALKESRQKFIDGEVERATRNRMFSDFDLLGSLGEEMPEPQEAGN